VEDIALMSALPNMTVLVPCDATETRLAVLAAAAHEGPVYLRVDRNPVPDIYPAEAGYAIGRPVLMREGADVALLSTGIMTGLALDAAERLHRLHGVNARVIHIGTMKPFDGAAVAALCRDVPAVITCEEHLLQGGLGQAAAYALRGTGKRLECVAIQDRFGQSAETQEELLAAYGLDVPSIVRRALHALDR
jgi:transketolase